MVVQAYILVQTNVGKAAEVANAISALSGVTMAEDVTGPYDVIVRAEAVQCRRARPAGRGQGPDRPRHHPHGDLPGRPHLRRSPLSVRRWPAARSASLMPAWPGARSRCPIRPRPGRPRRLHRIDGRLPTRVLDQRPSDRPPGTFSAAWGRPPIMLRCGVAQPAGLTAASECFEVNGVGWFAEPADGRPDLSPRSGGRPSSRSRCPRRYAPEAQRPGRSRRRRSPTTIRWSRPAV